MSSVEDDKRLNKMKDNHGNDLFSYIKSHVKNPAEYFKDQQNILENKGLHGFELTTQKKLLSSHLE